MPVNFENKKNKTPLTNFNVGTQQNLFEKSPFSATVLEGVFFRQWTREEKKKFGGGRRNLAPWIFKGHIKLKGPVFLIKNIKRTMQIKAHKHLLN